MKTSNHGIIPLVLQLGSYVMELILGMALISKHPRAMNGYAVGCLQQPCSDAESSQK